MKQTILSYLILFSAVTLIGCRDAPDSSKQKQSTEHNASKPNESSSSEIIKTVSCTYSDDKCEHHWTVASDSEARLAHGWVSFTESENGIQIKEHGGGGSSLSPLSESLELILKPEVNGDLVHLQMIRKWEDRTATLEIKTSYPKGASMVAKTHTRYSGLTKEYQVLWRADIEKEEKVVKSVAYLARLSPIAEQYDGFGKYEMAKVEAALSKHER